MIYATDIDRTAGGQQATDKNGFYRRCGHTMLRGFLYLGVTAGVFIAVGGAALAALAR